MPGAQVCKLGAWGGHQHSVASTNKALTIHFWGKLHTTSGFAKIGFRAWRALKSWDSFYLHSTYLLKYTQSVRSFPGKFEFQSVSLVFVFLSKLAHGLWYLYLYLWASRLVVAWGICHHFGGKPGTAGGWWLTHPPSSLHLQLGISMLMTIMSLMSHSTLPSPPCNIFGGDIIMSQNFIPKATWQALAWWI